MRKNSIILAVLATFALILTGVSADPTGATVTDLANATWTAPGAGNFTAFGGNTTEMNVSAYQVTGSWVGFWGELNGGVTLRDAGGNAFYEWSVTDFTDAAVYACNESTITWAGLTVITDMGQIPADINDGGTDDFNNTFTAVEDFNTTSVNLNDANYTTTEGAGTFKTYAMHDPANTATIWAGLAVNNGADFAGGTSDYQILAPAPASGGQLYYFYLEMP